MEKQLEWITALLIDGARRVGISYIVKEFATNEYKSYITIIRLTNSSKNQISFIPLNQDE